MHGFFDLVVMLLYQLKVSEILYEYPFTILMIC